MRSSRRIHHRTSVAETRGLVPLSRAQPTGSQKDDMQALDDLLCLFPAVSDERFRHLDASRSTEEVRLEVVFGDESACLPVDGPHRADPRSSMHGHNQHLAYMPVARDVALPHELCGTAAHGFDFEAEAPQQS